MQLRNEFLHHLVQNLQEGCLRPPFNASPLTSIPLAAMAHLIVSHLKAKTQKPNENLKTKTESEIQNPKQIPESQKPKHKISQFLFPDNITPKILAGKNWWHGYAGRSSVGRGRRGFRRRSRDADGHGKITRRRSLSRPPACTSRGIFLLSRYHYQEANQVAKMKVYNFVQLFFIKM